MTCRECDEFLSDYLSGELPAEPRAIFERHLTMCPNCRIYLEQFRTTILAGKRAFDDDPEAPAAMPEELIQAILAARKRT